HLLSPPHAPPATAPPPLPTRRSSDLPAAHTRIDAAGVDVTRITRDHTGRMTKLQGADGTTTYEYDDACQLIAATGPAGVRMWSYDAAGRLVAETTPDGQRTFHYDVAGQLVRRTEPGGQTIEYQYDGQGRRIRATSPERTTDYTWSDHGWLSTITEQANGTERSTDLWVNALGELAAIDDTALHWDAAADLPRLVGIGDTPVLQGSAGFTGVGDQLHTPTWRH